MRVVRIRAVVVPSDREANVMGDDDIDTDETTMDVGSNANPSINIVVIKKLPPKSNMIIMIDATRTTGGTTRNFVDDGRP